MVSCSRGTPGILSLDLMPHVPPGLLDATLNGLSRVSLRCGLASWVLHVFPGLLATALNGLSRVPLFCGLASWFLSVLFLLLLGSSVAFVMPPKPPKGLLAGLLTGAVF